MNENYIPAGRYAFDPVGAITGEEVVSRDGRRFELRQGWPRALNGTLDGGQSTQPWGPDGKPLGLASSCAYPNDLFMVNPPQLTYSRVIARIDADLGELETLSAEAIANEVERAALLSGLELIHMHARKVAALLKEA